MPKEVGQRPLTPTPIIRSLSDAASEVAALTWPEHARPDRFGVETEAFPVKIESGLPARRVRLFGEESVTEIVGQLAGHSSSIAHDEDSPPSFTTVDGGRLTFEPGAQIEHSSAPHDDLGGLNGEISRVWDLLETAFAEHTIRLVPLGLDPWHEISDVPQQQRAGRYVAMDRFFSSKWPSGPVMMRNTCSIQVNLDGGQGRARDERWLASNLISPFITAIFSSSPQNDLACARANVWQGIDPTRTGLPTWDGTSSVDALEDSVRRALAGNVMFVSRDGGVNALEPGWSFSDWVRDGHPEYGPPTLADLRTHLSTLFCEVRPRKGTLEVRAPDSIPRRWWSAVVVLVAALVYDDRARGEVIDSLSMHASELHTIWQRSARLGLADPLVASISADIADRALSAASSDSRFNPEPVDVAREFFDRFTFRKRSPADELRDLADDPGSVLDWAAPTSHVLEEIC